MLHIFHQMCVDELTFTLTRFLSKKGGELDHQGDFMKYFQTKITQFFDTRFSGHKLVEAWMVFVKGFISIEGWFVSFYKPQVTVQNGRIYTTYPYPDSFEDFSLKYREKCLLNVDPNDQFFHSIKFTSNGEAYKQFVKNNPSSAVQSKDRLISI